MADVDGIRVDREMWNVFEGDPLSIQLECLDDEEAAVDLTDYTVELNLVWGDDDDERLEVTTDVDETAGTIVGDVSSDDILTLPLGKKTQVFLALTPPSEDRYTTYLGKITVRHA